MFSIPKIESKKTHLDIGYFNFTWTYQVVFLGAIRVQRSEIVEARCLELKLSLRAIVALFHGKQVDQVGAVRGISARFKTVCGQASVFYGLVVRVGGRIQLENAYRIWKVVVVYVYARFDLKSEKIKNKATK